MLTKFILSVTFCLSLCPLQAQDQPEAVRYGWIPGGSIGLDLSGIGIVNPRVGSGANRFGLGAVCALFANKKEERSYWENKLDLQLSLQRLRKTKPTGAKTAPSRSVPTWC